MSVPPYLVYLSYARQDRGQLSCAQVQADVPFLRTPGDQFDHNLLGVRALTVLDPVLVVESKDISQGIALASARCIWDA